MPGALPAHFRLALLVSAAVLAISSPTRAQEELRRLPMPFERPGALKKTPHVQTQEDSKKRKSEHSELAKNELLARAANILENNGITDIKSVRTEGDHVCAEVGKDGSVLQVVVAADGTITANQAATTNATKDAQPSGQAEAAKDELINDGAGTTNSTNRPESSDSQSPETPAYPDDTAGNTSEAVRPGALSASNNTPR